MTTPTKLSPLQSGSVDALPGKPGLDIRDRWSPDCWCLAILEIHGMLETIEMDRDFGAEVRCRRPEQSVWFCWEPTDVPTPGRPPTGWSHVSECLYDDLVETLGGKPIYQLTEPEVDWASLLELAALDLVDDPVLMSKLTAIRECKRRERLDWARGYYEDR